MSLRDHQNYTVPVPEPSELPSQLINGLNLTEPSLQIIEQPKSLFRFRYRSESGTHGCILGETSSPTVKTHPTVQLVNYNKRAVIRCRLAQHLKDAEHPHRLDVGEEYVRDYSAAVPEEGSYRVGFPGISIIHTMRKEIPARLVEIHSRNQPQDIAPTAQEISREARSINLNIVRLRFSGHDPETDHEICEPVFSEKIINTKSPATLRICRTSRIRGAAKGGDDVIILIDPVNKNDIEVRFVERDATGAECWATKAHFLSSDVHHQCGISFRTPAYFNQHITSDVKVSMELFRPSDCCSSAPFKFMFTYDANPSAEEIKKRSARFPAAPSFGVPVAGPSRSEPEPMAVVMPQQDLIVQPEQYLVEDSTQCQDKEDPQDMDIGEPDLEAMLRDFPPEGMISEMYDYDIADLDLTTDSGMGKVTPQGSAQTEENQSSSCSKSKENIQNSAGGASTNEYTAVFSREAGEEVRKLVKGICELIKKSDKTEMKKNLLMEKLELLFQLRLSNGDTFLHMTLCNNRSSFDYITKLVHNMKMPHLLNLTNDLGQTILHSAVIYDIPELMSFLVSKGCDPSLGDQDGNTAVHLAVKYQACLQPLLAAIKSRGSPCDLDAYNKDKQTGLHLAAVPGPDPDAVASAVHSIELLLQHGAHRRARDAERRTPLHLAAYDDCLPVVRALLAHTPAEDVDAPDGGGLSALQVACGGPVRGSTAAIVQLLLDKQADPLAGAGRAASAWRLAADKPPLRALLAPRVGADADVKSDPEDVYESADEGVEECLSKLSLQASPREPAA